MTDVNALPGRLGRSDMVFRDDPRADPRNVAAMEATGMAGALPPAPINVNSPIEEIRDFVLAAEPLAEDFRRVLFEDLPPVQGVTSTVDVIKGVDGNDITLFVHRPTNVDRAMPGILHLHGGAMAMFEAAGPSYARWREELAATGLVVVGVEFRNSGGKLGPHPFPAGLNDCYSALQWMSDSKETLGVTKIVVSGESGGGNLALATVLKAKREGTIEQVDGVYAQCPAVSNPNGPGVPDFLSLEENEGYGIESRGTNAILRLYDPSGENAANPLAWPYLATRDDLEGLPPHMISVNELDPVRDQGLGYYRMLMRAGVSVMCRTVNGTSHAADCLFRRELPDIYLSTIRDIKGFADSL